MVASQVQGQNRIIGRDDENGVTKENGTDRFFLQTSCASGRNDEDRTDFKGLLLNF